MAHSTTHEYTSDEESSASVSQSSEYDTDTDDGQPEQGRANRRWADHVAERTTTTSLSRMVPQFRQQLTPVLNSFETRTVIIRSRDRDVCSEHLLQFGVQFGGTDAPRCSADSSCAAQSISDTASATGIRRGCTVPHAQRDVVDIRLTHVLLPRLTERLGRYTPSSRPYPILPPELFVRLNPHPSHRRLLGTGSSEVQGSSFWCVPDSQASDWSGGSKTIRSVESTTREPFEYGHTLYRPSVSPVTDGRNNTTQHHTREHYAAKIMLQVHLPLSSAVQRDVRFRARDSPDVFWLCSIGYKSDTQVGVCHVDPTASEYAKRCCPKAGDVVSLRDLHPADDEWDDTKQQLWTFVRDLGSDTLFPVIFADLPSKSNEGKLFVTLVLDMTMGGTADTSMLPTGETLITLDNTRSCALNESMQYTVGLEFVVATRHLSPSVVAPGQ